MLPRTTTSLHRPSINGRAIELGIGVTRWTQYDERRGVSTGTAMSLRRRPRSSA